MADTKRKAKKVAPRARPASRGSVARAHGGGGTITRPDEVERITGEVVRLIGEQYTRHEMIEALDLPPRTFDRYLAQAREYLAERRAPQRDRDVAEAVERVEGQARRLREDVAKVQNERLRAELLGLVGGKGGVAVQVNVGTGAAGVQAGAPAGDLSRLTAAEQVDLEHLTAVYEGEFSQVNVEALVARLEAATGRQVLLVDRPALPPPDGDLPI